MKRKIQWVCLAAAASVMAGCSSENQSAQGYDNATPTSSSIASSANAGQANMNFENGGIVTGGPATGTVGTGYQLDNPANQVPSSSANEGVFTRANLSLDQLPAAAQTTIRNQVGGQQITSIQSVTKDGEPAYKVELQKKSWFSMKPSLIVSADGSLLKESHLPGPAINEAAGAQAPQGSEANPSGATPTITNGVSGVEEWNK